MASRCEIDQDLEQRLKAYEQTSPGAKAPQIHVGDFDLHASEASNSIIVFWASWCPHCQESLPVLYREALKNSQLQIVSIALDADEMEWEKKR